MKKVCQELLDFFQNQEGWNKEELLAEYTSEVLKTNLSPTVDADELLVVDGDGEDVMNLQDFADQLFDKIIEGVCNVIETA